MRELLRLAAASSGEDGTFYLCAACIALQQEKGGERKSEALLASLLQLLSAVSPACESTYGWEENGVGGEGGEEGEGEGEGEGGWGVGGRMGTVWQLCREAAKVGQENQKTLLRFVCGSCHFQVSCCQLVSAALAVGYNCGVLQGGEIINHFLMQILEQFWSIQIDRFAKQVGFINLAAVSENKASTINVWCSCIKHIALLHILQEMHRTLISKLLRQEMGFPGPTSQTGLPTCRNETDTSGTSTMKSCKLFLCEDISNPLATRLACVLPHILYGIYLQWWNNDHEILKSRKKLPTTDKEGVGLILKVGVVHCLSRHA